MFLRDYEWVASNHITAIITGWDPKCRRWNSSLWYRSFLHLQLQPPSKPLEQLCVHARAMGGCIGRGTRLCRGEYTFYSHYCSLEFQSLFSNSKCRSTLHSTPPHPRFISQWQYQQKIRPTGSFHKRMILPLPFPWPLNKPQAKVSKIRNRWYSAELWWAKARETCLRI